MHKITMYENLLEMLEHEITEIEKKGELDEKSLEHLYKLTESQKNICKYLCYLKHEDEDEEYNDGYSTRNPRMHVRYSTNPPHYYSRDAHMIASRLEDLKHQTSNATEKAAIQECIDKLY